MARKYHSIKGKSVLPLPSRPTFKQNEKMKEGVKFFEYWQDLSPELAQLARVRVYRMKPPIDLTKIGQKVKSIQVWEGAIPFKADEYEKEFYEATWAGGGDYRCAIEEIGLSGVACEVFFSLSDWDTYPPKVPDAALMVESNAGKEYVAWRARRGEPVVGVDLETERGEEDFMTTGPGGNTTTAAAVVTGVIDVLKDTVNHAREDAKDEKLQRLQAEAKTDKPSSGIDSVTLAASEGIRLMGDVTREAMKNSNAPDPVEMFKSFAALIPPPPDPAPMFNMLMSVMKESNERIASMQSSQIENLRNELNSIRSSSTALATQQPKSVSDQLREMKESAELLGYSRTGDRASAAPAKSTFEEWGPIIQMGLQIFSPLLGALTAKLSGVNGTPSVASPPLNGVPNPPQAPPLEPENPQLRFLKTIEPSFMSHLMTPDCNGFTFAAHVLSAGTGGMETVQGRASYNWIKQNYGTRPDRTVGLDALIRTYEPMWNLIEKDLPKYQKFLTEFFNYDEQVGGQSS